MKTFSVFLSLLSARNVGQTVPLFIPHPADVVVTATPIPEPKRITCHPWQFPSAHSFLFQGFTLSVPMHPVVVLMTHISQL
jgi:hypothetical protein